MAEGPLNRTKREQLLDAAREVSERAYAPYSAFNVGAAVLTANSEIYRGCNVENASYGLSICAERAAVFAAVAGEGARALKIQAVAVRTVDGKSASPCGACRQVILEFNPDAEVIFQGSDGMEVSSARDLLPRAFTLE